MKKTILLSALVFLVLGILSASSANFPLVNDMPVVGGDTGTWGNKLLRMHNQTIETIQKSLTENGSLKNNIIQLDNLNLSSITLGSFVNNVGYLTSVVNFSGNYNNLTNKPTLLSQFNNDVGYLTNLPDSYNSATNAIYLQPNRDGTARVRFFSNTTGSPIISVFGYNSVLNSRPWIYAGMFDIGGGGNMRGVIGASGDYGDNQATMEIQSPYQVRITGVDNNIATGNVRVASRSYITFHSRTLAETDSAKYLTIDTVGQVQGANVELSTNSGDLVLNPFGSVQVKGTSMSFTGDCTTGVHVENGIITGCI